MKKLYYDLDTKKYLTEEEIRKFSLECETRDIMENVYDYLEQTYSIDNQIDLIRNSIYGDIDTLVENLNRNWNYNIDIQDKNVDFLLNLIENSGSLSDIREITKQVKEIVEKEQKNKDKALVYIGDRLYYNAETGEFALKGTFDKCNLYELYKIIKGEE